MSTSPQNNLQTQLANQKKLYTRFKDKCYKQTISVKTGLREALMMWFRHEEMGDKSFSRYLAQEQIRRELVAAVRQVYQAKSVSEASELLEEILQEY